MNGELRVREYLGLSLLVIVLSFGLFAFIRYDPWGPWGRSSQETISKAVEAANKYPGAKPALMDMMSDGLFDHTEAKQFRLIIAGEQIKSDKDGDSAGEGSSDD